MADESDGQEKTQDATPKKREKMREEGQVPRSREFNMLVMLFAFAAVIILTGDNIYRVLVAQMKMVFSADRATIFHFENILLLAKRIFIEVGIAVLPIFLTGFIVTVCAPMLIGGWNFSGKAFQVNFGRMNPLSGIARMFSIQAVYGVVRSLGKFCIVMVCGVIFIRLKFAEIVGLSELAMPGALTKAFSILSFIILGLLSGVILIVAIDVPFQLWQYSKKSKMSLKEIKDEFKQQEGSPEMKGRIRSIQQRMAQQRMMGRVPNANVVVTNPTHYAVALLYDEEKHGAPRVVAKGAGYIADRIREIAETHKVPLFSAPPLARSLYFNVDLEQEIPSGLYIAVAKVMAYIYQLKRFSAGFATRPRVLKVDELSIPKELARESLEAAENN